MRINHKQLFSLPVYTEEEIFVGYVVGLDVSTDSHAVVSYYVSKHKHAVELINSLVRDNTLLITPAQVVSISSESMIVRSTAVPTDAEVADALSLHQVSNQAIDS